MNEHSIAYESIKTLKMVCLLEFIVIIVMVIGFFIYESQFNYGIETSQTIEDTQNSTISQVLGGEDEGNNNR